MVRLCIGTWAKLFEIHSLFVRIFMTLRHWVGTALRLDREFVRRMFILINMSE